MARPINLLHWREKRRRECVRFWGLLCVGGGLITLLLIISSRAGHGYQQEWRALRQQNDRALMQALILREGQLKARLQQRDAVQARFRQQTLTRRWNSTLLTLAEQLPEQAWLTTVQWQGDAFSFSGLTLRFPALSRVESAVHRLPGFRTVSPGPIQRDAQGRWQFSYQLQTEVRDVESR